MERKVANHAPLNGNVCRHDQVNCGFSKWGYYSGEDKVTALRKTCYRK